MSVKAEYRGTYNCSYVYAKILKADFKNCSVKIYDENALKSLRPLIRCACTGTKCDKDKWEFLEKTFKCQKFKDQRFGDKFESATASKSWICYIEIKDFYEGSQINGGHFDVNAERNQTKVKECHDNGIFDDPLFCCVNIVNEDQRYSECTKEKQIDRFQEYKAKSKEPSESGNSNQNHGMDSKHIHLMAAFQLELYKLLKRVLNQLDV
uniref:Uncharacterized protein n=1 Tax=Panagrolaimus superbus TaxID=310955 RepID=A0A914Z269_9BILA